jgi:hypothetical protein
MLSLAALAVSGDLLFNRRPVPVVVSARYTNFPCVTFCEWFFITIVRIKVPSMFNVLGNI